MKKKLLSALLCLALALTLLPTATLAAPTRLKSVDLVIDLPTPTRWRPRSPSNP